MAFWSRVKESQIRVLSNRLKICYFQMHHPTELPRSASSHATLRVLNKPSLTIHTNRVEFLNSVRFFAAPVQANPKKEEKDTGGPRLNEKVTAAFVRLVTDEGHVVISRLEALGRARSLNLDLVEVDRNAKPPVCKIMDYNKEKYVKQVKEKELAKKKSDLTLKKGGCKEVRFLGKTEQRDLKIKADTIKRMMDKGHRVKCMAVSNGSENENLGEVLSRLSSLIEDVALIESGPHVEKKQAYIVVRHVKFGPTKKGSGKKTSTVAATSSVDSQEWGMDSDAADVRVEPEDDGITEDLTDEDVENKLDWMASDVNVDMDEVSNTVHSKLASMPAASSTPFQEKRYRGESGNTAPRGQENRYVRQPANGAASASFQSPAERENRYRRDPANAAASSASFQAPPAGENRYRRETVNPSSNSWGAPPGGDNRYRREQPQFNTNSSSPQRKSMDPRFLNKSSSNGFTEQHSSQSGTHRSPASGYGIFSVPQAENAPGKENVATGPNRSKKENLANSARYSTNP